MTESTHDRIASKASRLRDLMRLAKTGAAKSGPAIEASSDDDVPPSPSWTGGGWAN